MTKHIFLRIVIVLIITIGIYSCNILDITRTETIEFELSVSDSSSVFMVEELLDAAAEFPLVDDYGEKIESVEITRIEFMLTNFQGPDGMMLEFASLDIADTTGVGRETVFMAGNENMKALSGSRKEAILNQPGVDRFEELYKNKPHAARFIFEGSADNSPLDFDVKFFITVKVTGNPL